jgi:hypothetical protein
MHLSHHPQVVARHALALEHLRPDLLAQNRKKLEYSFRRFSMCLCDVVEHHLCTHGILASALD